jgi:hypothetical protein
MGKWKWEVASPLLTSYCTTYISGLDFVPTPQLFYTYFYNQACRLCLEKQLYIELSRSSSGLFKPLLDPGGGFTSETAERRFQK